MSHSIIIVKTRFATREQGYCVLPSWLGLDQTPANKPTQGMGSPPS